MNLGRYTAVTSPAGIWDYTDLIGAVVKIKSLSVESCLFAKDCEETYKIEDIRFRLDRQGKCITSIHLEGINRPFGWNDLEILNVELNHYNNAVCGGFSCNDSLSDYNI